MSTGFGLMGFTRFLGHAPSWMDIVTGYDYAFLSREEVQAWAKAHAPDPAVHPAVYHLATMDPDTEAFQKALWAACAEVEGSVSRVGHARWLQSADRWRLALIRETLAGDLTLHTLAGALERIYDAFGCPDDMVALWDRKAPWEKRLGQADLVALQRFLAKMLKEVQAA